MPGGEHTAQAFQGLTFGGNNSGIGIGLGMLQQQQQAAQTQGFQPQVRLYQPRRILSHPCGVLAPLRCLYCQALCRALNHATSCVTMKQSSWRSGQDPHCTCMCLRVPRTLCRTSHSIPAASTRRQAKATSASAF